MDDFAAAAFPLERIISLYPNYSIQFPMLLAWIYYGMKQYEDAYEKAQETLRFNPNYFMGSAVLAAICAQTDKVEEAQQAIESTLQAYPDLTLRIMAKVLPVQNPESLDHIIQGLRIAGLPE